MHVLIATDGSDDAITAARRALEVLHPDATVELVMVVPELEDPETDAGGIEGPIITPHEAEEEFEASQHAGHEALERTAAALGREVSVRLAEGGSGAGHGLVQVAEEVKPDVLVIGPGQHGFLGRIFTPSVSEYVVHHASCPVLIIRHHS